MKTNTFIKFAVVATMMFSLIAHTVHAADEGSQASDNTATSNGDSYSPSSDNTPTESNSSYAPGSDNTPTSGDSSYKASSDNTPTSGNDSSYTPGSDNTPTSGGSEYVPGSDNTPTSGDSSYIPGSDNTETPGGVTNPSNGSGGSNNDSNGRRSGTRRNVSDVAIVGSVQGASTDSSVYLSQIPYTGAKEVATFFGLTALALAVAGIVGVRSVKKSAKTNRAAAIEAFKASNRLARSTK